MRASLAVAALCSALVGGGCAGGGGTPAVQAPKVGPEIDATTAESDAKGLVGEVYNYLGRGKADNLIPLLAPPLVVFGPRRLDLLGNRADALVALGKVIDPKKAAQVRSGALAVVPAPGGRSAWAVDTIMIDGAPMTVTAVMSNSDDLWLVDAATIARTPTKTAMKVELKRDAVVPPGMAVGPKADPRAQGAIDRFQKGIADQAQWGMDLESRQEPIVIGPLVGEVARGKADVKTLWTKRIKTHVREVAVGEIDASVTPDGKLAWVTAPVTRAADDESVTPLRVFAIYENSGGAWKLTALHESLAIDAPGAGAAFRKIAPPAPAPPPVEKKAEAPAVEKVAAKKKKAKPAAAVDDEPVVKKKPKAKPAPVADDDEDKPKKPAVKKKPVVDDDEVKPAKKTVKKKPVVDDDDDRPVKKKKKKRKKPVEDDDDEVKVTDE